MAQTIGPTVSEAERRQATRCHVVGLLIGSVTMAFALTILGGVIRTAINGSPLVAITVAAVSVGWAGKAITTVGMPYPRSRWQVPENWRQMFPPAFTAGVYGYLLGLGFLTDVVLPAYWALVGLTIGLASFPVAVMAWLLYGAARAFGTTRMISAIVASPALVERLDGPRGFRSAQLLSGTMLLAIATYAIAGMAV